MCVRSCPVCLNVSPSHYNMTSTIYSIVYLFQFNFRFVLQVTIFQECQPEFLHDLVLKMNTFIFTPGDSICRKGEIAREMFIIADGILEVLSDTGKVLTTMKAGDFFGEIGILNIGGGNK